MNNVFFELVKAEEYHKLLKVLEMAQEDEEGYVRPIGYERKEEAPADEEDKIESIKFV